jgi:hypothetical protein
MLAGSNDVVADTMRLKQAMQPEPVR